MQDYYEIPDEWDANQNYLNQSMPLCGIYSAFLNNLATRLAKRNMSTILERSNAFTVGALVDSSKEYNGLIGMLQQNVR